MIRQLISYLIIQLKENERVIYLVRGFYGELLQIRKNIIPYTLTVTIYVVRLHNTLNQCDKICFATEQKFNTYYKMSNVCVFFINIR